MGLQGWTRAPPCLSLRTDLQQFLDCIWPSQTCYLFKCLTGCGTPNAFLQILFVLSFGSVSSFGDLHAPKANHAKAPASNLWQHVFGDGSTTDLTPSLMDCGVHQRVMSFRRGQFAAVKFLPLVSPWHSVVSNKQRHPLSLRLFKIRPFRRGEWPGVLASFCKWHHGKLSWIGTEHLKQWEATLVS